MQYATSADCAGYAPSLVDGWKNECEKEGKDRKCLYVSLSMNSHSTHFNNNNVIEHLKSESHTHTHSQNKL